MTQEDKELLLKYLCMALPYNIYLKHKNYPKAKLKLICVFNDGRIGVEENCIQLTPTSIDECKPYLRPMSSMTEEEKEELLNAVVGEDAIKYFQVLPDGSIDNTDTAHQDLYNFTMHWVNFDATNTSSYLNWLLEHHFDFMGLIPKDLAIEVTEENNPYENGL